MKPSEFYEKYWKIKKPDGSIVSPRPLTDVQKDFLDNACVQNMREVIFGYARRRPQHINIEYLMAEMEKLPDFIKPEKKQPQIQTLQLSESTKKWIEDMREINRLATQQIMGICVPTQQSSLPQKQSPPPTNKQ